MVWLYQLHAFLIVPCNCEFIRIILDSNNLSPRTIYYRGISYFVTPASLFWDGTIICRCQEENHELTNVDVFINSEIYRHAVLEDGQ